MKYEDFVNGINTGTISKATFEILDYHHYKNCTVECVPIDSTNSESGRIIWFYLTPDGYEKKGFLHKIKEDSKLFHIKGKGTFTLKQLWNKVNINSIDYASDTDHLS